MGQGGPNRYSGCTERTVLSATDNMSISKKTSINAKATVAKTFAVIAYILGRDELLDVKRNSKDPQ